MNESLKGLLTEEQAREIVKIIFIEPTSIMFEDYIENFKQAGIIRKSARQEFLEHLNVMKNSYQLVEQDFIDLLDLFHKAEAENKSKE